MDGPIPARANPIPQRQAGLFKWLVPWLSVVGAIALAQPADPRQQVPRPDRAASAGPQAPATRQPTRQTIDVAAAESARPPGPFQYREAMAWNERRFFYSRTEYVADPPQEIIYGPNEQMRARAAEIERNDPASLLVRYARWMQTGRLTYAVQGLRQLLGQMRQPNSRSSHLLPMTLHLLGEAHLMLGALPLARGYFADAASLLRAPAQAPASTTEAAADDRRLHLADMLTRQGEVEAARASPTTAIAFLSEAAALNRAAPALCFDGRLDASYQLSLVLEAQERWDEAEKLWTDEVAARTGTGCGAEDIALVEMASFLARKGDIVAAAAQARALLQRQRAPRTQLRLPAYWLVETALQRTVNLAPDAFPAVREAMVTTLLRRIVLAAEWKVEPPSERHRIGICGVYETVPQFDADSLALNAWWRNCIDLQLSIGLDGTPDTRAVEQAYQALQSVRARYVLGRAKLARDAFTSGRQPSPATRLLDLAGIAEARSTVYTESVLSGQPMTDTAGRLLQRYDDLESTVLKLLQHELEFELGRNDPPLTAPLVAGKLADNTALVEIFAWRRYERSKLRAPVRRYGAFVLRRNAEPKYVDLGPADTLDRQVQALSRLISQFARDPRIEGNQEEVLAVLGELSQRLVAPVWPHVAGATRLLVIPDGALAMVPFAALPNGQARQLIDDFNISYLSAARELFIPVYRTPRSASLVIGAPDFEHRLPGSQEDRLGTRPKYVELAGTSAEVSMVARVLGLGPDRVFTGAAAGKRALQAAQGPKILHLATHGDFLPPPRDAYQSHLRYPTYWQLEDPFLRSVIVFAGANRIPDQSANGIMTALEVSNLSLFGTRLAVVSVCTRDRARVELDGQSTSAMRLALNMAGADAVLSTNWPIPDLESAELVVNFYLAARKETFSEALRQAQLRLRAKRPHPFYWAAFTFAGKDGMLD
jgi:CHAT domain-containing protein/tetratricopeptide (TPR) repeat protein